MNLPKDFSDRLSPMLVKELRQGLRTRSFTSAFILLQAVLMFSMFVASSVPRANRMLDGFFWFFLGLTLLFIMPLRGVNALHRERQQGTLELIYVTQLSALRIVAGKWAAIFAQSLLLTVAVLPYVVLRYYFGGIDLLNDLRKLAFLLLASAVFTAFTVGFSAFRSILLRGLLFVGIALGGWMLVQGLLVAFAMGMGGGFGGFGYFGGSQALTMGAIFLAGVFFVYYFLAMGASRIAPASENYSTLKRILSLFAIALILISPTVGFDEDVVIIFALIVMIPIVIDALTEQPSSLSKVVLQKFRSSRILPASSAYFLAPGWHTGIFYFLIVTALFGGAFGAWRYNDSHDFEDVVSACTIVPAVLVFPMLVIQLFMHRSQSFFNFYVIIQCVCTVLTAILVAAAETVNADWILWMLFPLPHVGFVMIEKDGDLATILATFYATLIAATVIVTIVRARPLYRQTRAHMKKEKTPAPTNAVPSGA